MVLLQRQWLYCLPHGEILQRILGRGQVGDLGGRQEGDASLVFSLRKDRHDVGLLGVTDEPVLCC